MSSQYSTLYYQLLKKISTSWQELPDKPDESPEKTLHALWLLAAGMSMSVDNIEDAANNLSPKVIARYCYDLAVSFNSFYEKSKVLGLGDDELENSRICLVNSFKIVLEKALDLLGIQSPDRM